MISPVHDTLDAAGFVIIPDVVSGPTVLRLRAEIASAERVEGARRERNERLYALRNLLSLVPAVRELAEGPEIRAPVTPVLGSVARCVRGILFDKTGGANWKVAWHQDLSIAVKRRMNVPGFGPWSIKAGVQHVQPPVDVLENMLTVRLHLDDCGPDNGPLDVLPGSHAHGVLDPASIDRWRRESEPVACLVGAGGALMMRPLLLHASSSSARPGHRRVVHLEYAAADLPGGLEWHEDTPTAEPSRP